MMGKLHTYMQNNQTGPLSYNMQRTELKMHYALSRRPETTELEKTGRNLFNSCLRNDFLDLILNTKDKQIVTTGIIAEVNKKKKEREMK